MLAAQLGAPITHFGEDKAGDLLAIKQKMGLPDERFAMECKLCDLPEQPGGISIPPRPCATPAAPAAAPADLESIVQAVTDAVMAALEKSKS